MSMCVCVWVVPLCLCIWGKVFKLRAFRGPLFPTPFTLYVIPKIALQSSTPLHRTTQHNGPPGQNHSALRRQYLHYRFSQQNKHSENWMVTGNITFEWADEMGAAMIRARGWDGEGWLCQYSQGIKERWLRFSQSFLFLRDDWLLVSPERTGKTDTICEKCMRIPLNQSKLCLKSSFVSVVKMFISHM